MNTELIRWFKETFMARTPAKSVLDAVPSYRVTWHEIDAKMVELGYAGRSHGLGNVVDRRQEWSRIFEKAKLRSWCNKKLKAAGEQPLPRRVKTLGKE